MQCSFAVAMIFAAGMVACQAAGPALTLEDTVRLEAQSVPQGKAVDLRLPALPAKPGRAILLRFRAVITSPGEGGCNYNASVALNGTSLGRHTAAGDERLVGRDATLELAAGGHPPFPVFSGEKLMMMFAPTVTRGDAMATDGLGATFVLDLSDAARGVDVNTLTFQNHLPGKPPEGFGALRAEEIEVGWLDRAKLPKAVTAIPQRGAVGGGVTAGELGLALSRRGGFVVRLGQGLELLVETGVGMRADAPSVLVADDAAPESPEAKLTVEPWGAAGYRVTATWSDLLLTRTLALRGGLVEWKECWTNTGEAVRGVPFRHRAFFRSGTKRFFVGGSSDNSYLTNTACNPTLFLESAQSPGNGVGLTAESDWLRLLLWLGSRSGVGEAFTQTLALAPKSSIDLDLTLSPVLDGGSYWSFINGVRRRWGVNGIAQERPFFWGYARGSGEPTAEAQVAKALGNLGPITVVIGPWQRLEPDVRALQSQGYPKLPPEAPRAPGACPDFDVNAWLTFAHREPFWEAVQKEAALIHRAAPQAKVMQMLHPSMEVIYKPLQDRWPLAAEGIRRADGRVFEEPGYTNAWLGDWSKKDWGVLYYVPRPGSAYLEMILDGVRRGLDECGLDGVYCDEFSWAFSRQGYSRYDCSRWDGYSAELDASGKVVRLMCDAAQVTESCQLRMADMTLRRGKLFLGNGGNALRSLNSLPVARFIEGGNGPGQMSQGHLSPTPLVLGNMGDEKTRAGVFASVKACLAQGCIYSPMGVNLLLEGPDNFVCKLHPLSVEELGPGWVVGKERLITTVSRTFRWPEGGGKVRVYRYDAKGERLEPTTVEAGRDLALEVPERGLTIAERL